MCPCLAHVVLAFLEQRGRANPVYERSSNIWWRWHPCSALIVSPCHQMNCPEWLLRCAIIKPALANVGVGWAEAFLGLPMQYSKKGEVAGCTKVLMPEGLTRRRRYVTSSGFGWSWVWCVSESWWMTFSSFPLNHIGKKSPLPQMSFCSPTPELQMVSTHASPLWEAYRGPAILLDILLTVELLAFN